ncbi:MAG TPA: wax ester/triacylglycerol synthase domain-containing protein, partial [Solirubrobacteraceae bacterium]|nr:wax ester/triacylglycerol synthase domain-containing protein [Solirubrobacteraceae bacterium]
MAEARILNTVFCKPLEIEMSKQQMSSADVAWLHMDRPTNLMIVNSVVWFEEPMDFDRAREIIRERLVERFPRFRQRVVEPPAGVGVPSWVDDPHFDIHRHIHHLALPAPGDTAVLQEVLSDLISAPLDRSKALWDVYVLDGYGTGMALLTRVHHSVADGIALARVLLSMADERPDAGIAPIRREVGQRRLDSIARPAAAGARLAQAALHEGFDLLAHPESELRSLAEHGAADARALGKLTLSAPDQPSVLRGELGVTQKVTWIDGLQLAEVKAIGHAT